MARATRIDPAEPTLSARSTARSGSSGSGGWPAPPAGLDPDRLVWAETVHGGGFTHLELARGTAMRLTDLDGDACAHLVAYNADQPTERLNIADTVRIAPRDILTAGALIVSDQGRALATIVGDTSERHDPLFGSTTRGANRARFGERSGATRSSCELLGLAAAKHDLQAPRTPRDLTPAVSFFQGVAIDDDGVPVFLGSTGPGASVTLRAELPLVVLIANTAHPLDGREEYTCTRLEVLAWRGAPTSPDDPQWVATPDNRRAYTSTAAYLGSRRAR